MILLIDNYDSMANNLYQLMGELNDDVHIVRNDAIQFKEVERLKPSHIVISPGPCRREDTGICGDIIKKMTNCSLLCLGTGTQLFYEMYGGKTIPMTDKKQGQSVLAKIDTSCSLFSGLPEELLIGRYDSICLTRNALPSTLSVIAESEGKIMGVRKKDALHFGLLFHPESILTTHGREIMRRFLI